MESSLLLTVALYGCVTLICYYLLFILRAGRARVARRQRETVADPRRDAAGTVNAMPHDRAATILIHRGNHSATTTTSNAAWQGATAHSDVAASPMSALNTVGDASDEPPQAVRVPIHVSDTSAHMATPGGHNLLTGDGLVGFRHAKAFALEQSLSPTEQTINRKNRARILSKLMGDGLAAPPNKGTTMVVVIPTNSMMCGKLRRVLYLLGTHYNLLVILALSSSDTAAAADVGDDFKKEQEFRALMISRLRGMSRHETGNNQKQPHKNETKNETLIADVLPDHRIVLSTTVAGRVAFVRQLQRVELVLDFDPEVRNLLSRFGHKVLIYGETSNQSVTRTPTSTVDVACDCQSSLMSASKSGVLCLGNWLL